MTAAHAGWGSEVVPVGGGGAICERLCEAWRGLDDVEVAVLGTGPHPPAGVSYRRVLVPPGGVPPTRLSEMAYAGLCRRFEAACTAHALKERANRTGRADRTVVLAHDISEGPTFERLRTAGIPSMLLVHVDVVEYFTRMYLRGFISPQRAVWLFAAIRALPVVPDVLRLVFDKQYDCAAHATRVVLPAPSMRDVLERCYPRLDLARKISIVPWGAPESTLDRAEVDRAREGLRQDWGIREGERVLLTLSRISPEKGQDRLLEALLHAERTGSLVPPPSPASKSANLPYRQADSNLGTQAGTVGGVRVVICGAPAFMQGEGFLRRLQRLAARLRTPVVFAGHLEGTRKRAALELADVFVAASRHESYGLTTLEAYAAGAPVVAVESHGSRATVDADCGFIVANGAHLAPRLWEAIARVLEDDDLRDRLAAGARRRAERERFANAATRLLELARTLAS